MDRIGNSVEIEAYQGIRNRIKNLIQLPGMDQSRLAAWNRIQGGLWVRIYSKAGIRVRNVAIRAIDRALP